jgi:peptidoglycan/LPS O-acetylase OafA/YrhL
VWLVVTAAIRHENPHRAWSRGSGLGQALGRWSYSLYVTHWIVLVLLSRFLVGPVWIVPSMAVCILGAAVLYTTVERPAEHYLRRVGRHVEPSSPAPTPDPDLVI